MITVRNIRWTARISGIAFSLFIITAMLITFGKVFTLPEVTIITILTQVDPVLLLYFLFWGIALLSLLIAPFREVPSSIICLISLVLMTVFGMFTQDVNKAWMVGMVLVLAMPAVIYIYLGKSALHNTSLPEQNKVD